MIEGHDQSMIPMKREYISHQIVGVESIEATNYLPCEMLGRLLF